MWRVKVSVFFLIFEMGTGMWSTSSSNINWCIHFWKSAWWQEWLKLHFDLAHSPAVLPLGMHPREMLRHIPQIKDHKCPPQHCIVFPKLTDTPSKETSDTKNAFSRSWSQTSSFQNFSKIICSFCKLSTQQDFVLAAHTIAVCDLLI